jgi:hypothetical protein
MGILQMKRLLNLALGTAAAVFLFSASTASAATMTVIGLGLDFGGACLSTAPACSAAWEFPVVPTAAVTGTFDYTFGAPGSMDIELDVADFSITGGPGPDGVEEIVFTDLHISITGWLTLEVGSDIQGLGFGSATLTGFYEELDGVGGNVDGPTAINSVIDASALTCPVSLVGQCGFLMTARDLVISVGDSNAVDYDVQLGINVLVTPEPSTALLVAFGLLAVPALRNRS